MNNYSRNAFTHDIFTTGAGYWLQHKLKIMMLKWLLWCHRAILISYDKDAYVLDDPRLQKDKAMLIDFFAEWTEERIQVIINKAADIFFFFLKEDGRYRRLYIVLRNKLILEGQIYALTNTEQDELLKWKGK